MDSKNYQRGIQLLELGRYKEAIPFLQKSSLDNPDNLDGKYHLAICYLHEDDIDNAAIITNALLHDLPNEPDIHFLKARIAFNQDESKQAIDFVNQAISLDPYNGNYFGLKSGILLSDKKYEEALEFVNEGLSIDAKNAYCLNLRAQILTKLGRINEANETVDNILYDNPEDSYSHANIGWVELENGNIKKALDHFKQALQLDPNFEYAREGMSTALKSKNFIYKWYLKYSFWLAKKSSKNQWVFIIGIYIVYRMAFKLLSASGMTYLAFPLMIAYLLFALGSWFMEPLSNTILNFDSYGKFLLSKDEKISGYLFGGLLLLGTISVLTFYTTGIEYSLVLAVTFICTLIPLPRALLLANKKRRSVSIAYGCLMIAIGLFGPMFTNNFTAGLIVVIMMIAYTWIGNFIEEG